MSVSKSSENMLPHALLSFLFFNHGFFRYVLFYLDLFCPCFMCNKYYLMLLNFRRYLFSVNTICFIDEKHTQWNLDTKVKYFMKVFMFHETSLKLHFMKCSERKVPQCKDTKCKATLLKSHFGVGVPLEICCIFSGHLFLVTPLGGCFLKFKRYGRRII